MRNISTGCYIDGHWGQYATARLVKLACEFGWEDAEAARLADKHLSAYGPSSSPDLTDDEYDELVGAADDAEAWLNEHAADNDHGWLWEDGEFFYSYIED